MTDQQILNRARDHFATIVEERLQRVERLKADVPWTDFEATHPIIIGILGGDGIGPSITAESRRVLEHLLQEQVDSGKVEFRTIEGLTIENRAAQLKSIPEDVLEEIALDGEPYTHSWKGVCDLEPGITYLRAEVESWLPEWAMRDELPTALALTNPIWVEH